jgi:hypothetical protein
MADNAEQKQVEPVEQQCMCRTCLLNAFIHLTPYEVKPEEPIKQPLIPKN